MLSFLAIILGVDFYNKHQNEIHIAFGVIVFLIVYYIVRRRSAARRFRQQQILEAQERQHRLDEENEERSRNEEAEEDQVIHVPKEYEGKQLAYQYEDVKLISAGVSSDLILWREPLILTDTGDSIDVYQDTLKLGSLPENHLADMVRDWNKCGDPYLSCVAHCSPDGSDLEVALFFYVDKIARFLSGHPDAKLYKLSGKPEEFSSPAVGDKCSVDYDLDKDKYPVMQDGSVIGVLPASAVRFAEDHDMDPEDLTVLIGSVDYDQDKDRDIISVYISK